MLRGINAAKKAHKAAVLDALTVELDVVKLGQTQMNKKEIDLQLDWYRLWRDKLVPIKKKILNKPEMFEELSRQQNGSTHQMHL
jgi:hypothetical protein